MELTESLSLYTACVHPAGSLLEIRPLPAERGESLPGWVRRRWVTVEDLPLLAGELWHENQEGKANIFIGVLPRTRDGGGKDDECAPGCCVWCDLDDITPSEAEARIASSGMPVPTAIINTGHGAHGLWRVNGVVFPSKLSRMVGDLATMLQSDPTVRNPSRILRAPGFTNWKQPVAECKIVVADPTRTYDFNDLRACVPVAGQVAPVASVPCVPRTDVNERAARYVDRIPGASEGGRNQSAYRVACILRQEFALPEADAKSILAAWNQRNNPPLPEAELDAVLNSGSKYAQKPLGCKLTSPPPRGSSHPKVELPMPFDAASELPSMFEAEARGDVHTLSLPWTRTGELSQAGRPGTTMVLAGPAGYGKTWLLLQALIHWRRECNASFAYLPLERDKKEWERRLLAYMCNDWGVLDMSPEGAAKRAEAYHAHSADLPDLACGVCENPRLPQRNAAGKMEVSELPPGAVLDWIERAASTHRVVAIDPLSQIDWESHGARENKAQSDFMRQVVGIAAGSMATIILACHTVKRPGATGKIGLTLEDIQGSAQFNRLADTVLLLDAHEPRWSDCYAAHGCIEKRYHNRTVVVGKARNGPGCNARLAFNFEGVRLVETGVLAPKQRRATKED